MSRVRVHCFSVSVDGYSAGPNQDVNNPVGVGGLPVFGWQVATRTHHQMHGEEGGDTGTDNDLVARGFEGIGAWIIGRNMFGPVRGPWPDDNWKGWWGRHSALPHSCLRPHQPPARVVHDEGNTTFHFVADGILSALNKLSMRPMAGMSAWEAGLQPCGNIFPPASSMRCIWPFRLS